MHGPKRKNASAGRSAPARTSCRRRGMAGAPLQQSGTETHCPWGNLQPGEVWDTSSFSFRCRWPVVDESCSICQATAPTTARAARSEAERAERDAGQMRSCTPTPSALSATGRQLQTRRRPKRARRPGKIGAGTTTPTPVRTEGHCTGVRPSALFFWTVHGPFSFRARPKRKWGVHPRWTSPLAGASPPWPPFGGPNHLRAVDNCPYAPAESDPGIRHSPAGADLTQPAG